MTTDSYTLRRGIKQLSKFLDPWLRDGGYLQSVTSREQDWFGTSVGALTQSAQWVEERKVEISQSKQRSSMLGRRRDDSLARRDQGCKPDLACRAYLDRCRSFCKRMMPKLQCRRYVLLETNRRYRLRAGGRCDARCGAILPRPAGGPSCLRHSQVDRQLDLCSRSCQLATPLLAILST